MNSTFSEMNKPPKKDAAGGSANPGVVDVEPLKAYQNQIAVIQRDSVW